MCQRACKPGSVHRASASVMCGHSSRGRVAPPLKQPTRATSRNQAHVPPLFGLAPGGVYRAGPLPDRGALLPHPFDLTGPKPGGVLSVALSLIRRRRGWRAAGRYPAPWFRGARTFLASLAQAAAARPSGGGRYRGKAPLFESGR